MTEAEWLAAEQIHQANAFKELLRTAKTDPKITGFNNAEEYRKLIVDLDINIYDIIGDCPE